LNWVTIERHSPVWSTTELGTGTGVRQRLLFLVQKCQTEPPKMPCNLLSFKLVRSGVI
jgi:hypothetical protein